ncbi:MAG: ABC transporter substrate-binding protein [Candidatus Thermoplasmatota archaeon]|nr:ABC transporter substrate-binding protein [Candidatus Thermoplasmatota archaeon]
MFGIINFAHSDPFYLALNDRYSFMRYGPRDILSKILSGVLDGGMVSLVSYLQHTDQLTLMESATISSKSATISTILVSREEDLRDNIHIAVTAHTETTVFYAKEVLKKMGIRAEFHVSDKTYAEELLEEEEYALVIGDEALKAYRPGIRVLLDIGHEFSKLFHMPPVYAVTVCSKGADCKDYANTISRAIKKYRSLVKPTIDLTAFRLSLNPAVVEAYFNTIDYTFDISKKRTIEFVSSKINEMPSRSA